MRRLVRFLLVLLVILAIGWLGGWWYAEGRLELAIEQGTAALKHAGWTVSHGAITRGSSPLTAHVSVTDLRLTPPSTNGPTPTITLPMVDLTVHAAAPFTLDVALPTAWQIALDHGPDLTLHFSTIVNRYVLDPHAVLAHEPNPVRAEAFRATDLRVDTANTNFTLISVASLSGWGTRDPQAGKDGTAFSMHEKLTGLALSPIFATLGNLPFGGKLSELRFDLALSGPPLDMPNDLMAPSGHVPSKLSASGIAGLATDSATAQALWHKAGPPLHRWAQAGGHGTFGLGLKVGPLDARDTGSFGFDDKTQPVVKTHLIADGIGATLGTIANHYPSLVDGISKLTAATAPYMKKGPNARQRLAIDLALAGGVLTANGRKAADVPAVVWPPATSGTGAK